MPSYEAHSQSTGSEQTTQSLPVESTSTESLYGNAYLVDQMYEQAPDTNAYGSLQAAEVEARSAEEAELAPLRAQWSVFSEEVQTLAMHDAAASGSDQATVESMTRLIQRGEYWENHIAQIAVELDEYEVSIDAAEAKICALTSGSADEIETMTERLRLMEANLSSVQYYLTLCGTQGAVEAKSGGPGECLAHSLRLTHLHEKLKVLRASLETTQTMTSLESEYCP